MKMGDMSVAAMDLDDFAFDVYLANDRTLDDPEIVPVDKGGRVLLRIINGTAATVFWIDIGFLSGRLMATDGNAVVPVAGTALALPWGSGWISRLRFHQEAGRFRSLRCAKVLSNGPVLCWRRQVPQ